MGIKKTVKKTVKTMAASTPVGRIASIGMSLLSDNKKSKKGKGSKKQTVAKIKRKIALMKAKKELAKLRGY